MGDEVYTMVVQSEDNNYNLWVDDIRKPPNLNWIHVTSSERAISVLRTVKIKIMSLDHDLGGNDTTRPIVLFLCENPSLWPKEIKVHSANPVGKQWLEAMIERYKDKK